MICQHCDNHDWHSRCTADGTHHLRDNGGKRVPGVWCLEHANEIAAEYNRKLGWNWVMERIEGAHDE